MRYIIFYVLWLCAPVFVTGQWNYTVETTQGINTTGNDIATDIYNESVFFTTTFKKSTEQQTWSLAETSNLLFAKRKNTFQEFQANERVHSFRNIKSESGVTFSETLSGYIFSSEQGYGASKQGVGKIYFLSTEPKATPTLIPFCEDDAAYYHPHFVDELNLLIFSSNRRGGQGGLDIWYSYYHNGEWTNPANCGGQVNTSGEEIYPTFFDNDIYFSSNGWVPEMGFELFKSEGSSQWMNALQLEFPLNSEKDDFSILFLNNEKGILSSNRSGSKGASDIFYFKKVVKKLAAHGYTARLESSTAPIADAHLHFLDSASELVLSATTDYDGICALDRLSLNEKFLVKLSGVQPDLYAQLKLYLIDGSGNVIGTYQFNEKGELILELLQFVYSDLALLDNEDKSILNVQFAGRIQAANAKGVQAVITVLDIDGNIIAVAKSDVLGKFNITSVSPLREYVFKISKDSRADQIVLFDNGSTVVLPILAAEAYYRRIPEGQGIRLLDENKREVVLKEEDLFIVNRVYFDHNSSVLNSYAKEQLDAVSRLLSFNSLLQVDICSYADARGGQAYNLQLSKQRAMSLLQYLKNTGVEANRISYTYKGESDILNECDDSIDCIEEKHAINRRTEIKFVAKELTYSNPHEPKNRN
jgi:outer membrane protein OmpA-like peptidoglycan-associated protein